MYPELEITPQEIGLYVFTTGFLALMSKKNNFVNVRNLSINLTHWIGKIHQLNTFQLF